MHLTPEEFVDIADGVRTDASVPHLAACAACRASLAALQAATLAIGGALPVPEPSPLFWNQFQRQVNDAVAGERTSRSVVDRTLGWARTALPVVFAPSGLAGAAAVIALAVFFVTRGAQVAPPAVQASPESARSNSVPSVSPRTDFLNDSLDDDPSLDLVAALTKDVDLSDDAAGLTARGSADHAVTHMDATDLRELKRLLALELGT